MRVWRHPTLDLLLAGAQPGEVEFDEAGCSWRLEDLQTARSHPCLATRGRRPCKVNANLDGVSHWPFQQASFTTHSSESLKRPR